MDCQAASKELEEHKLLEMDLKQATLEISPDILNSPETSIHRQTLTTVGEEETVISS